MPIWIDDMFKWRMGNFKTRSGRVYKMSHMMGEPISKLHQMADRIGVERRWFQDVLSGAHYDVTMSKRKLALEKGAISVTMREMAGITWCLREGVEFTTPAEAKELFTAGMKEVLRGTSKIGAIKTKRVTSTVQAGSRKRSNDRRRLSTRKSRVVEVPDKAKRRIER